MKINYYPDTDSLYIEFSEKKSSESVEISGSWFLTNCRSKVRNYRHKKIFLTSIGSSVEVKAGFHTLNKLIINPASSSGDAIVPER